MPDSTILTTVIIAIAGSVSTQIWISSRLTALAERHEKQLEGHELRLYNLEGGHKCHAKQ